MFKDDPRTLDDVEDDDFNPDDVAREIGFNDPGDWEEVSGT